jgi:2-polyprenyl-3-methyl-5-hydroxy-6-metoxy-1,4-benzoquinol methylase
MPTLPDLYLRFTFDLFASEAFEHLHWGLFDGVAREPRFLPDAQRVYGERVLAMLPPGKRVLDVGCGLGGLSRMMVESGREVVAISPREDHIALIAAERFAGLTALCTTFEDLPEPDSLFDALVFAESFNFFVGQHPGQAKASLDLLAERCAKFVRPGGRLIFADIVTEEIDRGIRAMRGFSVVSEEDVHEHAAYSATAFQQALTRGVWPYHRLLMGVLEHQAPALRAEVERVLLNVPNVPLRAIFEGRMLETDLARDRRYRMYALESLGRDGSAPAEPL